MVLSIAAYGSSVLRKICSDISPDYPMLGDLIENMWETMYYTNGVGIAAPQVSKDIRLFVIDSEQVFNNTEEDDENEAFPGETGFKGVFINAHIVTLGGKDWSHNEGCLSIPNIRENILRKDSVTLDYLDENFMQHRNTFSGLTGRIILHEYDHLDGKMFIDHISPLKKTLLKRKLDNISKGKISVKYKMSFPK